MSDDGGPENRGSDEGSNDQGVDSSEDVASAALSRARSAARAAAPARRRSAAGVRRRTGKRSGPTGPGADDRDPQRLGATIPRLLAERGWQESAREATVLGSWDRIVGADLAAHCAPQTLRDGELVLAAESTAWATQIRLLAPRVLARIAEEVGPGVVRRLSVHGPTAPSWSRGPRRVPGRGPRDTYG